MAEPQKIQTQKQTQEKERVFSFEFDFKFKIKEEYNKETEEWYTTKEVVINGKTFDVYDLDRVQYEDALKAIRVKLAVLQYMTTDEATDVLIQDILLDIARILYRLHYKLTY
jgi:hypothetical protein